MITVLTSPKPGTGTTTTAALLALAIRHATHTHVVDLRGDLTAVLGVTHTTSPTTHITDRLTAHDLTGSTTGEQVALIRRLAAHGEHVVIDTGSPTHPTLDRLPAGTIHRWVLRPCFLALRNATTCPVRPDEVIVLEELGRALTARDVEAVTGAPVTATIEIHPQVARAVDAGLLTARPPAGALAVLRQLTTQKAA